MPWLEINKKTKENVDEDQDNISERGKKEQTSEKEIKEKLEALGYKT